MEQIIKVAVIGGTGKSGKYLVKQLISQGFHFKVLLRNPESFQINSPLVEVIKGDARDYNCVQSLIRGCQAVISTLGQPKGESAIFSQATRNVIQAMNKFGVQRYILTTGLNVDTPFDNKSNKTKFATEWMKTNYAETTADKQEEYNILSESKINWTLVRLPLVEQTDKINQVSVSLEDCPGDKISATDLAKFLIGQLYDNAFNRTCPFIASI
jgi:putative NADH-flavin reductase